MPKSPKSFTDHITLWIRWRWFLIGVTFCAALLTFAISSIIPKTYRSTATVLPPFEGGATLPFLEGISIDIFGRNEVPASGLVVLLKSRALKDRVNDRINLIEHYKKEDLEKAYKAFEDHLQVEMETEESFGAVTIIALKISVLDKNPEFCAKMVNVIVEEWDNLYTEISRRGASLRRQFVEENLYQTSAELASAEDSLRFYQEKHGITSLDAQVQGTVEAAIALEQKIADARITVQVLEKMFQSNHPELQRAKLRYNELLRQQKRLYQPSVEESLLLPLGTAPEISLKFARQYRRVRTLEAIHQVLVQQFEQLKMQELKETPALRIIDLGSIPIHKYKPKRLILTIMAMISALFFALLAVYFLDYLQRTKGSTEQGWIEEITQHIKTDFQRMSRFLRVRSK